jgi:hypothetical protein
MACPLMHSPLVTSIPEPHVVQHSQDLDTKEIVPAKIKEIHTS